MNATGITALAISLLFGGMLTKVVRRAPSWTDCLRFAYLVAMTVPLTARGIHYGHALVVATMTGVCAVELYVAVHGVLGVVERRRARRQVPR